MGLKEYFRKRQAPTPEPKTKAAPKHDGKLKFVVQKHHARAMHYDFRLEIDGVLKSWAVPKGPSLNPHDHRLAIQTEDHPYDYRKFEGVIPKGAYGAGNVIIWDEGWYEPRADEPSSQEALLKKELKKGHLTFVLHGQKLHGEFALIKMQDAKEENAWLLVKKDDEHASAAKVSEESVASYREVDDLGASGKLPNLSDYPKRPAPKHVKPMLCTLVDEPFDGDDWLFEIKWDGYRAIGTKDGKKIDLRSRNDIDFTSKFSPITEAMHAFKNDVVVDGEICAVDADGRPHFNWLQGFGKPEGPQGELRYFVFDVLWVDGRDVQAMPLNRRKALLKSLMPKHPALAYSDDVQADGKKLFAEMQRRGLEGMVAKRADGQYKAGVRGEDWLKVKTHLRQEVVIGGYTEPRGGRKYFGSLLVGVYDKEGLRYVGHSGGGGTVAEHEALLAKLKKLERSSSPFITEPKPNAPVHWVRPELVAEMSFSEWTADGMMRHPELEGLRPDKSAKNVHQERTKPVSKATASPSFNGTKLPFEPTHLDKVFFPKAKLTKGDLFDYYQSVAKYILPYIKDRPMSLNRMPNGITSESFYQKNVEHLPDWAPSADIHSESTNEDIHWLVGDDLNTLLYMVQLGCIEINPWNSRVKHLDTPDWMIIDLDPEGVSFEKVIEAAQTVKAVCDEWGIAVYPKTSGKTGLHVFAPLGAKYAYGQSKNLAHLIVLEVNKRLPSFTSVERSPEKRRHKIYLDFLQNREGQTLAAPYSVRPTPTANVSMPLKWNEVKKGLKPEDFTIKNALTRLKKTGDIWKPVLGKPIDLKQILKRIEQ